MKVLNVKQGSQEWLDARATKNTASEASAMMGESKWMSRDELLHQKKTGETEDISPVKQKIFDKGHQTEAMARPIAERIVGEPLYPSTAVNGKNLASFDGATITYNILFEHKLLNKMLVAAIALKDLPASHYWQLEHQMLVCDAAKILFVTSDGTEGNFYYMWYESSPKRRAKLIAGWAQFDKDLEDYEPVVRKEKLVAAAVKSLPSITYKLNGLALTSNLDAYKVAAEKLVAECTKEISTDQDFADRELLVKKLKQAEKSIDSVIEQVLGEVGDIDQFRKDLIYIQETIKSGRIPAEKSVKNRKDELKEEVISSRKAQIEMIIANHNLDISKHGVSLPSISYDFRSAIKGKKTIKSIEEAANDELAKAQIEVTKAMDLITKNLINYLDLARDYTFLFPDLQSLVVIDVGMFTDIIKGRINDHVQHEQEKMRKHDEEKAAEELLKEENPVVEVVVEKTPEAIELSAINHREIEIVPPMSNFEHWWFNTGSGIIKKPEEDNEQHAYRVATAAYQAGK